MVVVLVVVLVHAGARGGAGAQQLDVAVERFQFDPRAARAYGEVEAVFRLVLERDREAGLELAVEGRDRHRGARLFGQGDGDVAVVGREPVVAAFLHAAVVLDVPVHRIGVHVGGVDAGHVDPAVHRLGGDVTGDVAEGDVVVHGGEVDVPLRVFQCDRALHRLEGDVPVAAARLHVALDRLRGDVPLGAVGADVHVGAGEVERHPGRDGDVVVDGLRAPPSRGAHRDHGSAGGHGDHVA